MEHPATLGQTIRARRAALQLTQEELADRIGDGVRQAEISRLESDRVTLPRRERLERIAIALDMSIGELLALSGWTGADHAFGPAHSHSVSTYAVPTSDGRVSDSSSYRQNATLIDTASRQQLQIALDRARAIRAQTAQLLDVSSEVARIWWDSGRKVRRDETGPQSPQLPGSV